MLAELSVCVCVSGRVRECFLLYPNQCLSCKVGSGFTFHYKPQRSSLCISTQSCYIHIDKSFVKCFVKSEFGILEEKCWEFPMEFLEIRNSKIMSHFQDAISGGALALHI